MGKPQYPDTTEVLITLIETAKHLLTVAILAAGALGYLVWHNTRDDSPAVEPRSAMADDKGRTDADLGADSERRHLPENSSGQNRIPGPNRSFRSTTPSISHNVRIQNEIEVHGDVNIQVTESQADVQQTTETNKPDSAVAPRMEQLANSQARACRVFGDGVHEYWSGESPAAALKQFESAHKLDATDARPLYFCALTHLRLEQDDLAAQALAKAVEVETRYPIYGWGRMMERVQGDQRLWIENARLGAGVQVPKGFD